MNAHVTDQAQPPSDYTLNTTSEPFCAATCLTEEATLPAMTLQEAADRFRVEGLDLSALDARQEGAFQNCLAFVRGIPKAKRQNLKCGSYRYKHMVEVPSRYARTAVVRRIDTGFYVYEGTFILAALASGFTMQQREKGRLRATFNISQMGLRKRIKEIVAQGGL